VETIAVFDFDGILTREDSFKDFLLSPFGIAKFGKVSLNIFPLTGYALGFIINI